LRSPRGVDPMSELHPVPEPTLAQIYGAILSMAAAMDRLARAVERNAKKEEAHG
jgi:hypothetical protein